MSFLGMGTLEILIILLVAFIFLGPERMVDAARTLGRWSGELRRMGSTVQAEIDDIARVDSPSRTNPASANQQPLDQENADNDNVSQPAASPSDDIDSPVAFRSGTDTPSQVTEDAQPSDRSEERA